MISAGEVQPLAVALTLKAGEGLPELILRATAENFCITPGLVFRNAGLDRRKLVSSGDWVAGHEEVFAKLLGLPGGVEDLRNIVCQPAAQPGWHDFFGARIRLRHRTFHRRRVSPLALKSSVHLRAIWSIKSFCFDASTRETLIDECPECGHGLGWHKSFGLTICEHCAELDAFGFLKHAVDLRDYPQPLVEVNDEEGLAVMPALIDPDPEARSAWRSRFPDILTGFDRGQLFELGDAFARSDVANPDAMLLAEAHGKNGRRDWQPIAPPVLAAAGRALLDWPASFHAAVERSKLASDFRRGYFGIWKELGPLLRLRFNPHIEPKIRKLICNELQRHFARTATAHLRTTGAERLPELVPVDRAARETGVSRSLLRRMIRRGQLAAHRAQGARKAPSLVRLEEVNRLAQTRREFVLALHVSRRLGIPRPAFAALNEADLLMIEENKLAAKAGEIWVRRSSLESLEAGLREVLQASRAPKRAVSLYNSAVHLGAPFKNPWPEVLSAILGGRLRAWRTRRTGPLTQTISILWEDLPCSDVRAFPWSAEASSGEVSVEDCALLLGTTTHTIYNMRSKGLIPERAQLTNLQSTASRFVLNAEVTRMFAEEGLILRHGQVPDLLRSRGISPAVSFASEGSIWQWGLIWKREEIEATLSEIVAIREGSRRKEHLRTALREGRLALPGEGSIPVFRAAKLLGVPKLAFRAMAASSLVDFSTGRAGAGKLTTSSFDTLVGRIEASLLPGLPSASAESLLWTSSVVGSPDMNPWPGLISDILSGKLPAWRAKHSGAFATAIKVDTQLACKCDLIPASWTDDGSDPNLTIEEAGWILGIITTKMLGLMADGLLPRRLRLSDVQRFSRRFMLTREVAWAVSQKVQDSNTARRLLRKNGVHPAAALKYRGALVWEREEITRFIAGLHR